MAYEISVLNSKLIQHPIGSISCHNCFFFSEIYSKFMDDKFIQNNEYKL